MPAAAEAYRRKRESMRAKSIVEARAGRDIGDIPPVKNPSRKAAAMGSFKAFCHDYFPRTINLPWSNDHLKMIEKIEIAVREGGLFAIAMFRGSGKTTICERACIWALLMGYQRFVMLVGADRGASYDNLSTLKMELSTNQGLLEDFPEVVFPIHRLENESRRCIGQLHHGLPTYIDWAEDRIVLPTIPGSRASGSIVRVASITGRIRGAKYTKPDGETIRPGLAIIDDPQTDESATSPAQVSKRETIINKAILNLAGPTRKIAAVMPCTVIARDDLADRLLDRSRNPEWQGERTKMVYSFPSNEALWSQYAALRADSFRAGGRGEPATEFYRLNRDAMDAGSVVSWPEKHNTDELSGLQHAMNLKLRNESAFWAECQNSPLAEDIAADTETSANEIAMRLSGIAEKVIPVDATHITMFIDIQLNCLFYMVAAWTEAFTGYVVSYGAYPEQNSRYYTYRDVRRTLRAAFPKAGFEGSIFAGLDALTKLTLGSEWRREDGTEVRIDRCMIDANWGDSTDIVYQFCRQSRFSSIVMPSHGKGIGASNIPMGDWARKPGERVGLNWRIPPIIPGRRPIRHIIFDVNFWKSFVHSRLTTQIGDPGSLTLFGSQAERHRLLSEHLTSEYRVKTQGRGRTVDEWKIRPNRPDNHWFDCLVGCAVGAAAAGVSLPGMSFERSKPKRSYAERYEKWQNQG